MLFNSSIFLFLYLPAVLLGYFGLAKARLTRAATAWLVLASLFFYGYWDVRFVPLLLGSIAFNYTLGHRLSRGPSRALLTLGVVANLALLGYFKYADFFLRSAGALLHTDWALPGIVLPLGISFFTFTQIAYLVDAHRGRAHPHDPLTYSLFVTVFPHLIAGPILHHQAMIPQFTRLRNFVFSHRHFAMGVSLLVIGLFKKVAVADSLVGWVTPAFANAPHLSMIDAWAGATAYTFQLYFDFSGYSDMAIGLGLMLNLKLPINFDSPYKATSIIDFWRRWHISLSNFLRDYLYIPLGGNRHGEARRMGNLLTTMLLGGLWHGAGWTFAVWGGLHGVYLVANHQARRWGLRVPRVLGWGLTFAAVTVAWVFFRAGSLQDAAHMVQAMAGLKGLSVPGAWPALQTFGVRPDPLLFTPGGARELGVLAGLAAFTALAPNSQAIVARLRPTWAWGVIAGLGLLLVVILLERPSPFLYFQF